MTQLPLQPATFTHGQLFCLVLRPHPLLPLKEFREVPTPIHKLVNPVEARTEMQVGVLQMSRATSTLQFPWGAVVLKHLASSPADPLISPSSLLCTHVPAHHSKLPSVTVYSVPVYPSAIPVSTVSGHDPHLPVCPSSQLRHGRIQVGSLEKALGRGLEAGDQGKVWGGPGVWQVSPALVHFSPELESSL